MTLVHVYCGQYIVTHYSIQNDTSIRFGHHVSYNEIDAYKEGDETFLFEKNPKTFMALLSLDVKRGGNRNCNKTFSR